METVSRAALTFLLNAIWQAPVAYGVAWIVCRLMPDAPARHRHVVWVAALTAAVLVPLASVRTTVAPPPAVPHFQIAMQPAPAPIGAISSPAPVGATPAPTQSVRSVSFAASTAQLLLGIYALLVLCGVARLAWAWFRTVRIRRGSRGFAMPMPVREAWLRAQDAFGVRGVDLLVSPELSGPVTAGRTIIVPGTLVQE